MAACPNKDIEDCPRVEEHMERAERRRWQFSRNLDIGHLLVSIGMLACFFVWVMSQESRLTKVEEKTKSIESVVSDMKHDTRAINDKLDRLIEKK